MKKITSIILIILLILSMTACSSKTNIDNSEDSQTDVSENIDTQDDSTVDSQEDIESEEIKDDSKQDIESYEDVEISVETLMAAEENSVEDFEYRDNSEVVWITSYVGTSPIVVIPEEINGMPVTGISANAFDCISDSDTSIIKAINLSNVIEIEQYAFYGNDSLQIIVGNNVEIIDSYAFQDAINLVYASFSGDVKSLDKLAFAVNTVLEELIIGGNPVIEAGAIAFPGESLVLIGESGSTVEEFALENGLTFQAK